MAAVLLVGVDSSEASRRAVAFAQDRARQLGGELVIAHVIPWSPYSFTTPEENEHRHVRREAELAAAREQVLEPVSRSIGEQVPHRTIARHGHPAESLNRLAREVHADHITVGRTGESRFRSDLFGSVPSYLIQMADVPVTVVP